MQIYKTSIAFGRSFRTHVTGDTSADRVEKNMMRKDYNVIRNFGGDGNLSRTMLITPPEDYKIFQKFAGELAESSTPRLDDTPEYLLNRETNIEKKRDKIMNDIMFLEDKNAIDIFI